MSNIAINKSSRKIILYFVIISCVIIINVYTNRKYILNSFNITNIEKLVLEDSFDNALIVPDTYNKQVRVLNGYSIETLLLKEDISDKLILDSTKSLLKVFDPRNLKAGSNVIVTYDWKDKTDFLGYEIELDFDKSVIVKKNIDQTFTSEIIQKEFKIDIARGYGKISSTLYESAIDVGVSPNIIMNLIQLYSFDIDFQRDIKRGTEFEIVYENYLDDSGKFIRHGNILSAVLKLENDRFPIYRYTTSDGKTDYFNESGKSARKALLKTPVNGAYISSGFGMRSHPISNYTAFHRGIDFAVKQGTPIYASGDGVITAAIISNEGYGIHIKIRHPNGYETLYGHMVSHARGMYPGLKVTQGQVIGYVGSTGNSTGPHLHYETRYNGKFVNPSSIKIPPGKELKDKELEDFLKSIDLVKLSI